MKKRVVLLVVLSLIVPHTFSYANEERPFKILLNASNPISELTTYEISKLFLKKVKQWKESKEAVLPVDLVADSPVREEFSSAIHERKLSSIKAYWQKQIFSGRGVPPEEKGSDQDVLEYVAGHAGAIGYVSDAADIDHDDVKIVHIIKKEL